MSSTNLATPSLHKESTAMDATCRTALDDSKSNHASSSSSSSTEYVDYTPSPQVQVLPPAKYKLWLIVFVLVYFASWVSSAAELRQYLEFGGLLSYNASLFLQLGIIVFVLTYAAMDLFQTCLTFQTKSGKLYGVVPWLKQPRAQWMYQHENFVWEVAARVVTILEEGFAMFHAEPFQSTAPKKDVPLFCTDCQEPKTLRIEHRIQPDRMEDYHQWLLRIGKAVKQWGGICVQEELQKECCDEEEGNCSYCLALIHVKFETIDTLNDWMLAPRRKALMKQLEPMLARPDVVQIEKDRALPDAFSDLLTQQGRPCPKASPRKWKVWWLTLLALFVTITWTSSFLPFYFDAWGLSSKDPRLQRLVQIFLVTFLNTYVMTPLFLFLFHNWVQNDGVKNQKQPWKMLDQGFQSIWLKLVLTFAFYGGCVLAIVIQKHT